MKRVIAFLLLAFAALTANATNIHILFVYTPAAEAEFTRITTPTTLELARMNTAFEVSGIDITVTGTPVRTNIDYGPDLYSWEAARIDSNILMQRDSVAADVVIVVTCQSHVSFCMGGTEDVSDELQHVCGYNGFNGLYPNILPAPNKAVALVDAGCLVLNLTAQHELGHLLGTRDDFLWDSSTSPDAMAHGYVAHILDSNGAVLDCFWTIMANSYDHGCSALLTDRRIGNYTNPSVYYNGRPTGNTAYYANEASTLPGTAATAANNHATKLGSGGYGVLVAAVLNLLLN